jgi:hypothetical protein
MVASFEPGSNVTPVSVAHPLYVPAGMLVTVAGIVIVCGVEEQTKVGSCASAGLERAKTVKEIILQ